MTPFEKKLAAIPRREIPPEWREEILAKVAQASRLCSKRKTSRTLVPPLAWGALAAAWIVIAILNLSGPRGEELYAVTPMEYRSRLPTPQEYLVHAEWQLRLLRGLTDERGIFIERRYVPLPGDNL